MAGPLIQNFAIPAGDMDPINFSITPNNLGISFLGAKIEWYVYAMMFGVPVGAPVIQKDNANLGGLVVDDVDLLTFHVNLAEIDTQALLGNYYHRVVVTDHAGNRASVTAGVMTVTQTPAEMLT